MIRLAALMVATSLVAFASTASAQLTRNDIVGTTGVHMNLLWDGWSGDLYLGPGDGSSSKLESNGKTYRVWYEILRNPQDVVAGRQGPGFGGVPMTANHRILLWVDFTQSNVRRSAQVFDGYVFTQHRTGNLQMAGVTWWQKMPFGFYAKVRDVVG